jgi:hypothetical protein
MKISALLALLAAALPGLAALGDTAQSIESDGKRFKTQLKSTPARGYTLHEMSRPDGLIIHQYVSAEGKVFGVAWQGPVLPDLSQLLGSHYTEFRTGLKTKASRKVAVVRSGDLVVESTKRIRGFYGRAYLISLLPNGLNRAVIQ